MNSKNNTSDDNTNVDIMKAKMKLLDIFLIMSDISSPTKYTLFPIPCDIRYSICINLIDFVTV